MALDKELVAASTVPALLSILARGENYGYAIIQEIRALSGAEMAWTDGMLYPVLHRLEQQRLIRSRWRTSPNGRRRRYYFILSGGRRTLAENQRQWRIVQATLDRLWETIPCST